MKSPIVGLRVAGTVFGLMCLGQLTRLATQAPINVAGVELPLWLSVFGFLFTGLLCLWMWRLAQTTAR